ncbi:TIGR02265 family protein [Cystobacter fuscus]|uniref:TIGR02265 family protein n=1 Tax=Cystobacter fuscus TaxID=43 RepID=UPI002B323333|nr:TIGR02265 family protein [Cystobacter fuscus]
MSPPLEFSPGRESSLWAPRLAQATSEDMARGLFFQGALRAIRVLGDEELAARCSSACGQAWFFDFFNYSIRLFLEMVSTALPPLMERHGEAECTLWLMGHCVATDFLESEAGRAMQVLVRGEARRLVNHLPSTYLVSVNGTRSVEWLGPQHCRFTMKRDFAPAAFHEGMLVAMLERMDARRVHVVGVQTGVLDSEYDISWR